MHPRTLPLLALVVATAACAEPLEFAEWRIEVPAGTPVVELPPVPLRDRSADAVQLVDDLVLGGEDAAPEAAFYRPVGIVAAADGRIFVADAGDHRVLMFGADGAYLGSFGREGQGPGEFSSIQGMAIAAGHVVIEDIRNNRLSIWTIDGAHVDDRTLEPRRFLMELEGAGDNGLASTFIDDGADGDRHLVAAIHAINGDERVRLFDSPTPPPMVIRHGAGTSNSTPELVRGSIATLEYPNVIKAVGAGDTVYVSPAHEYQVLAMSPDGGVRWALRVAWPRPVRSLTERQRLIDNMARSGTGSASVDDFDWPPAEALEFLRTDGAGRLYVFPAMPREEDAPAGPRMVDVYSRTGELIAAGLVDHVWTHARGDYAYGLRANAGEEWVAVRYRLAVAER